MEPHATGDDEIRTLTLEAFADTIVPGEKRWPGDRAIAGVSTGGGAVAAGALELLETDAGGMAPALDDLVVALNGHAERHAKNRGLEPDDTVPPFVALASPDRIALILELTGPGHPEQALWVGLAIFCNMAFDTGAHLGTVEAMAAGHPGLAATGFFQPDADGLWRFPDFSYRRPISDLHPDTAEHGSLA